jgi:hypothetical protein
VADDETEETLLLDADTAIEVDGKYATEADALLLDVSLSDCDDERETDALGLDVELLDVDVDSEKEPLL